MRSKTKPTKKMNTSHKHLADLISGILANAWHSQVNLCLTEEGYDWIPKGNRWETQHICLVDQDGLLSAWQSDEEPDAERLAEWVADNVREWIYDAIEQEEDSHEPNNERIAFLDGLLENI